MMRLARLPALSLAAALISSCTPSQKDAVATHRPRTDETLPALQIESSAGRPLTFTIEIADTPKAREVGLMFRKELPDNAGMLFIFEAQDDHHFWMKNTYLPLDMIFIDETMTVVGIVHRAAPETLTSRGVGKPSRYVLEINGGLAKREGIIEGAKVTFKGFAPPPQ